MKRPARTFVVERRNGRKAQHWFTEPPAVTADGGKSAAVREANDLFRSLDAGQTSSKLESKENSVRVLEDLRDPEPAMLDIPLQQGPLPSPILTDGMPRRPRGRPRKIMLADGFAENATPPTRHIQPKPSQQDDLPGLTAAPAPEAPGVFIDNSARMEQPKSAMGPTSPAGSKALVSEQIIEAVVAQVKKRSSRTGKVRTADELPVGQRWKRRLHPASW